MKKLIFLNCVLALALIFSYCSKSEVAPELNLPASDQTADNRGVCTLTHTGLSNTATITLCGTNTNANNCVDCLGNAVQGVEVTTVAGLNLTLNTPITFSVRTNQLTVVNLTAGTNSTGAIQIPAGGCRRFRIDDNCNIAAL
ncbi:MAG: hypothetical protein SFV22_01015 [Saprospiraceae bacterium]|nr:hypothetical protein [Saprospiraceae bacterium]